MKTNRRTLLMGAAALGLAAPFIRPGAARAAEFTMKLANNQPMTHPTNVRAAEAVDLVVVGRRLAALRRALDTRRNDRRSDFVVTAGSRVDPHGFLHHRANPAQTPARETALQAEAPPPCARSMPTVL